MKRLLCALLSILLMIPTISFADSAINLSELSDIELVQLIKDARLEYFNRQLDSDNRQVIYDANGIKITLTGKHEEYFSSLVHLECVIENHTESTVTVITNSEEINGFQINEKPTYICENLKPGKKMVDTIILHYSKADIRGYSGLEEVIITVCVANSDTKEELFTSDDILITFP